MQIDFKSRNQTATHGEERNRASFPLSQLLLLQSRRRWGIMYMLATVSGLFVPIGGFFTSIEDHGVNSFFTIALKSRRTIPVVIGKKNTVMLTMIIATIMIFMSWLSFYFLPNNIGLVNPILVSLVASIAAVKMAKILKHLNDHQFIRKEHKKSIRWHLMLQSALIVGALLFWV
jgi:hypothetical protein